MRWRYPLLLVTSLLGTTCAFGQQFEGAAAVRSDFERYWEAVRHKDTQAQLDALDPRMFELVSRERLADGMERSARDSTVRITTGPATDVVLTGPFPNGDQRFAGVSFGFTMRMVLANEPDTDVGRKNAFLLEMLGRQYGPANVALDPVDGAFIITTTRKLVAVRRPGVDRWRFLEHGKDMAGVYRTLVPEELLVRLFPQDH
ncbi:MAG: hypothetical protein JNL05_06680 [Flavobacteriales bacterium]|nr:hypothetical protein [Flavobacteriales bacterium]